MRGRGATSSGALPPFSTWRGGKHVRKMVGVVLIVCILAGFAVFAPATDVRQVTGRLLPIMLFLASISVVVNLSAHSGLFRQIAFASSRLSRGSNWLLWLGISALSLVSTAFLSLDTTAVLITPLAMAVVAAAGVNPLPYAFTVIWLANTASLFLPVSNLTNLLAMDAAGFGGAPGFARLAFAPAAASVAATLVFTGVVFAKVLRGRHKFFGNQKASIGPSADPRLRRICAFTLGALLPLLVTPVPFWVSSSCAAAVLIVVFLAGDRGALRLSLVPWPAIALAVCLVVVVQVLNGFGPINALVGSVATSGDSTTDALQLGAAGALTSNILNNIPAYLLLEPAAAGPQNLMALLIGTNAGPLVTPWASLATLLWHDQLKRANVPVRWRTFTLLGCVLAPLAAGAALLALLG